MRIIIRDIANKDAKKLSKVIKEAVNDIVIKIIEADNITQLANCKKLKGHNTAYRIKYKDYRIGIFYEDDTVTVSRILHRKEVYRYFP